MKLEPRQALLLDGSDPTPNGYPYQQHSSPNGRILLKECYGVTIFSSEGKWTTLMAIYNDNIPSANPELVIENKI